MADLSTTTETLIHQTFPQGPEFTPIEGDDHSQEIRTLLRDISDQILGTDSREDSLSDLEIWGGKDHISLCYRRVHQGITTKHLSFLPGQSDPDSPNSPDAEISKLAYQILTKAWDGLEEEESRSKDDSAGTLTFERNPTRVHTGDGATPSEDGDDEEEDVRIETDTRSPEGSGAMLRAEGNDRGKIRQLEVLLGDAEGRIRVTESRATDAEAVLRETAERSAEQERLLVSFRREQTVLERRYESLNDLQHQLLEKHEEEKQQLRDTFRREVEPLRQRIVELEAALEAARVEADTQRARSGKVILPLRQRITELEAELARALDQIILEEEEEEQLSITIEPLRQRIRELEIELGEIRTRHERTIRSINTEAAERYANLIDTRLLPLEAENQTLRQGLTATREDQQRARVEERKRAEEQRARVEERKRAEEQRAKVEERRTIEVARAGGGARPAAAGSGAGGVSPQIFSELEDQIHRIRLPAPRDQTGRQATQQLVELLSTNPVLGRCVTVNFNTRNLSQDFRDLQVEMPTNIQALLGPLNSQLPSTLADLQALINPEIARLNKGAKDPLNNFPLFITSIEGKHADALERALRTSSTVTHKVQLTKIYTIIKRLVAIEIALLAMQRAITRIKKPIRYEWTLSRWQTVETDLQAKLERIRAVKGVIHRKLEETLRPIERD